VVICFRGFEGLASVLAAVAQQRTDGGGRLAPPATGRPRRWFDFPERVERGRRGPEATSSLRLSWGTRAARSSTEAKGAVIGACGKEGFGWRIDGGL